MASEVNPFLASGKEDLGHAELCGEGIEAARDRLEVGSEEGRVVQPLRAEIQRVDVLKVLQLVCSSRMLCRCDNSGYFGS